MRPVHLKLLHVLGIGVNLHLVRTRQLSLQPTVLQWGLSQRILFGRRQHVHCLLVFVRIVLIVPFDLHCLLRQHVLVQLGLCRLVSLGHDAGWIGLRPVRPVLPNVLLLPDQLHVVPWRQLHKRWLVRLCMPLQHVHQWCAVCALCLAVRLLCWLGHDLRSLCRWPGRVRLVLHECLPQRDLLQPGHVVLPGLLINVYLVCGIGDDMHRLS